MSGQKQDETIATWRKLLLPAVAGMICSIFVTSTVWSGFNFAKGVGLGASHSFAVGLGGVYISVGLGLFVVLFMPMLGTKYVQPEDTDELLRQRKLIACLATISFTFGAALVVLAYGTSLWGLGSAWLGLGLFGVGWIAAYIALRCSDELKRRIIADAALLALCLMAAIAMGWSVLAQANLVGAATQIDWLSSFFATALFSIIASSTARGAIKWW